MRPQWWQSCLLLCIISLHHVSAADMCYGGSSDQSQPSAGVCATSTAYTISPNNTVCSTLNTNGFNESSACMVAIRQLDGETCLNAYRQSSCSIACQQCPTLSVPSSSLSESLLPICSFICNEFTALCPNYATLVANGTCSSSVIPSCSSASSSSCSYTNISQPIDDGTVSIVLRFNIDYGAIPNITSFPSDVATEVSIAIGLNISDHRRIIPLNLTAGYGSVYVAFKFLPDSSTNSTGGDIYWLFVDAAYTRSSAIWSATWSRYLDTSYGIPSRLCVLTGECVSNGSNTSYLWLVFGLVIGIPIIVVMMWWITRQHHEDQLKATWRITLPSASDDASLPLSSDGLMGSHDSTTSMTWGSSVPSSTPLATTTTGATGVSSPPRHIRALSTMPPSATLPPLETPPAPMPAHTTTTTAPPASSLSAPNAAVVTTAMSPMEGRRIKFHGIV